jgi:4-diphosphocytidyl-2-C-methyl-D-erythritol kinase
VTSVTVRVPAKINLQLAVGPLRPDGYHDLVTVFHAVSLFDELTVAPAKADSVSVTGEGEGLVPEDGDNLALRAVRVLRKAVAMRSGTADEASAVSAGGVAVTIAKRIPVAGGMAGGSADAAAALVACNELWGAGLSADDLCALAGDVGSDVAFAVVGHTAIGRGRGEQLTPVLAAPHAYHWVIALADGHLSTPTVFRELDRQRAAHAAGAQAAGAHAAGAQEGTAPELSTELMAALRAGDPSRLGAALSNDLQEPALTLFPALRKTLEAGAAAGALGALISGSGPTCFFLADGAQHAAELAAALSGTGVCRAVATATGPVSGATVVTSQPGRV